MTSTIVDATVTNTNAYDLTMSGDDIVVTSAGAIINTDGISGISGGVPGLSITVDGLVYSADAGNGVGVTMDYNSGGNLVVNGEVQGDKGVVVNGQINPTSVSVGEQGSIDGVSGQGIIFYGNQTSPAVTGYSLDNAGDISAGFGANSQGVTLEDGGDDYVDNSGEISGAFGVALTKNVAIETVDNSGTIKGGNIGFSAAITSTDSSAGIDIVNSGLLSDGAARQAGTLAVITLDDNAGTTSTINNEGTITGSGYVIESTSDILDITNTHTGSIGGGIGLVSGGDTITNAGSIDGPITFTGTGGTNSLTNPGEITGSVTLSGGSNTVDSSGAIDGEVSMAHSHDSFNNAGAIDGLVSIAAGSDTLTNAGTIDGQVMFWSTGTGNSLTNSGSITGDVTLPGSSSAANHGQIYGDVILGAGDTLINTGTIHGNVTLSDNDAFDVSPGVVTGVIEASTMTDFPGDLFEFSGDFGKVTFDDFVGGTGTNHDTIQFAANDFGTFSQVQSASSQVGADVVIKLDATDSITLNNVTLASLVSADFTFV